MGQTRVLAQGISNTFTVFSFCFISGGGTRTIHSDTTEWTMCLIMSTLSFICVVLRRWLYHLLYAMMFAPYFISPFLFTLLLFFFFFIRHKREPLFFAASTSSHTACVYVLCACVSYDVTVFSDRNSCNIQIAWFNKSFVQQNSFVYIQSKIPI